MKRIFKKWNIAAFALLTGLYGCYDYSRFENLAVDPISPKIVVPVINSSITFKELVERENANTIVIQKPGDTKFYLAFRDTIEVGDAASLFTIPAVAFEKNFQLNAGEIPGALPAGQTLGPISKDFTETYAPVTGAEIKSIRLSQGSLSCTITNNFKHEISGTITLTSLKDAQGNSVVLTIPRINPLATNISSIESLANHSISLYDANLLTYNTFSFSASVTLYSNGEPISTTDNVNIQVSLNNLDFSYIIGKINRTIGLPDHDYKVDLFRSTYLADQHFDEPKLSFKFINGYGVPFAFNITNFVVSNTTSNETVNMANDPTPPAGSLLIGTANQINFIPTMGGNPVNTSLELNKNNSNIENMFDIAPNQFKMRSSITLGDATTNHDHFISKDAKLSVISEIELPLIGWVETNQINDTIIDIELPDIEEDLSLKQGDSLKITIKFRFDNKIPLDTYFQTYFLNDANQELTRLFNDQLWLIKSAAVDPTTGKATTSTVNYAEIIVNRSKYALMKDATKIVLQVKFKTGGNANQSVVIENTNSIGVQMSVAAEGTVNFDN